VLILTQEADPGLTGSGSVRKEFSIGAKVGTMEYVTPLLAALMLALSLASAGAQERAATAQQATAELKPPPGRKPIKRRPVQQVAEPAPRSVADGYRPPPAVGAPAALPPPTRMNSCDAGGCFDTNGARYNGGAGPASLSPQGQLCVKGAVTTQCF
jgi:hypothetical protein